MHTEMQPLLFQICIYVSITHADLGWLSHLWELFNTGNRGFPAVPNSAWDFYGGKSHPGSGDIENYGDTYQVTFCGSVLNFFVFNIVV